jgi:nucleoside-diphosphate-sugar epimerase
VFGGTGFLGNRIVRHLRNYEFPVRIASPYLRVVGFCVPDLFFGDFGKWLPGLPRRIAAALKISNAKVPAARRSGS